MADLNLRAIITAKDNASPVVKNFSDGLDKTSQKTGALSGNFVTTAAALAGLSFVAKQAFDGMVAGIAQTVEAANRQQAAFIGLSSLARAFGQDADQANVAARNLAKDGLMTVGEAATGLKNLLAAGFNLPQAIQLMNRFKDSAAFNRQAALGFGQAIAGATEGIKNGNSILVDNAGVTKNLSVILQEAGYSAQDLMKASTDAGVRQAIFNGILKETTPFLGDAARLSETFAGKQSALAVQVENLKAKIGEALQPALVKLLEAAEPVLNWVSNFVSEHPKLTAGIIIVATVLTGLLVVVTAVAAGIVLFSSAWSVLAPILATVGVAIGSISWPILAIGAAIAVVAFLVIRYWDQIKAAFAVAFTWISQQVDWFRNHFWEAIGFVVGFFATLPIKLPFYVALAIAKIVQLIASVNWGAVFSGIGHAVSDLLGRMWRGFYDFHMKIINMDWGRVGKSIGNGILGLLEGALNGALHGLLGSPKIRLPRFAEGVQNFGGGLAVVGERGPELVNLPRGSDVIPNHALGGGTVNVSVNVGVYAGSEIEKRRVAEELFSALADIANSRNTTVANMMGGS